MKDLPAGGTSCGQWVDDAASLRDDYSTVPLTLPPKRVPPSPPMGERGWGEGDLKNKEPSMDGNATTTSQPNSAAAPIKVPLLIIGCGFGGIALAIALKNAGRHDFTILE